jgi:electron transport complex protein RnfC
MATAIGVEKVIIGIEDNKMTAYQKLNNSGFEIKLLKKKYPQGAEKVLIYTCTKRKVPNKGGLPMDVGVVVQNVATAYAVYDAVRNNNPLYKRVLTVSGKGIDEPKNLWVLNGTLHKDIFEFCGGINDNAVKLISGGPMMGFPLNNVDCSTTKAESGLLALTEEEINLLQPTNCISCGRCAAACPMHLMPMYIDFYIQSDDLDAAVKYGAMDCFECGCCSFVCPAKRSLVQSVRLAKQKMRERKK